MEHLLAEINEAMAEGGLHPIARQEWSAMGNRTTLKDILIRGPRR